MVSEKPKYKKVFKAGCSMPSYHRDHKINITTTHWGTKIILESKKNLFFPASPSCAKTDTKMHNPQDMSNRTQRFFSHFLQPQSATIF